jgi:citrate lyase subunit beta / citryl-CoA lyase
VPGFRLATHLPDVSASVARRAPVLRRSWLFLPGAERDALLAAPRSGADVLIQELEDFTPPERRHEARNLAADLYGAWRAAGALAGVRVNPLEGDGVADLAAVMAGFPDVVLMSKVATPEQVRALDAAVSRHEVEHGLRSGSTELVPNVESAAGLVRTVEIARASPRVTACLVASEDMAADLGAERSREGLELAYARSRFLVECTAAGVVAIDCPYTFSDREGAETDTLWARRLGYVAKSAVVPEHAETINRVLTPTIEEVDRARRLVEAFEAARARGLDRVDVDGALVEIPTYQNARRLIARAAALAGAAR